MSSISSVSPKLGPGRSHTWPPSRIRKAQLGCLSSSSPSHKPTGEFLEDDLNEHPEDHYLSPANMFEFVPWDDSDDEIDDEGEWDAGITDFALFDNDRRRAAERQEPLPGKWDQLIANQASALQRSVERHRMRDRSEQTHPRAIAPSLNDVPHLTPDNSPNLRDDLHLGSHDGEYAPTSEVFNRFALIVAPPPEDNDPEDSELFSEDEYDSDDGEMPVSLLIERARQRRQQARKLERPGLRYNRTLSGKAHVWRRPSHEIYRVGEDVEAEAEAERVDVGKLTASGEGYDRTTA